MAPKRKKPASSSPRKAPARRHATTSIQEDTTSAGNARPIPPPAIPHVGEVSFPPPPQPYPPPLYYGAPTGAHGHYGYMIPPPAMHPPPHVQPSALGPAPTGFVHQPSSEFVRQAAKHVSGHAPPPFSPEPPEAAPVPVKKGKRPSYTDEHLTVLVDCVAQVRPMGPDAWARVEKLFNFHCNQLDWPPRTGTALREQWNKMVKLTKPPTGEGEFPPHIARAQALAKSIADEAGVAHVNDSAGMSGTNARYRHWLPKTPPRAPHRAARQRGHSPGNAIEVSSSDSEVQIIAVKPASVKREVKSEPVAIKQEAMPVTVKREVKREPDVSIKSRSSSYRAGQSSSGTARSTAVTSAPVARVGPSSPRRGRANRDEMLQQLVMSTGPQGQLVKSVLTNQEGNIRALEMGNQRKSARIDHLTDKLAEEARRADRAEAENRVMKLLLQRGFSGAARDLLADIDIGFPVLDRHQAGSSSGTRSYHLSQSPSRSRSRRPPLSSPRRTLPSPSPRRRHALSPSPSSRHRSARTHQTPSPTQTRSSSRPITWSPSPQRGVVPSPALSRNHHTPSSPIPHDLPLPPESHAASRSRPLGLDALALAASEVAAAGNDGLPETPSSPLDYV